MNYLLPIVFVCVFMQGCVKRTISITSSPSGALIWVNDREVGRTPVDVEFLYYGEYDVRVEKDGQEPVMTTRWASSPSLDIPIIDVLAEASSDEDIVIRWHFDLEDRNDDPDLLLERAKTIRKTTADDDVQ
jgi:hypothetical protein